MINDNILMNLIAVDSDDDVASQSDFSDGVDCENFSLIEIQKEVNMPKQEIVAISHTEEKFLV